MYTSSCYLPKAEDTSQKAQTGHKWQQNRVVKAQARESWKAGIITVKELGSNQAGLCK